MYKRTCNRNPPQIIRGAINLYQVLLLKQFIQHRDAYPNAHDDNKVKVLKYKLIFKERNA